MTRVVDIEGAAALLATFEQMKADFGPAKTDKGLVAATRQAMKPTLSKARSLAPKDTGALSALLRVEARRPNRKDKRSQYVYQSDVAVAFVTTPPAKKLAKIKFTNVKTKQKEVGIPSDARAIAQEFGTSKHAAQPYLRPALESQATSALQIMALELGNVLQKYRKKAAQ